MKYVLILDDGRYEIREDSSEELPANAIEVTDEQYAGLCYEHLIVQDGRVVPNPNPVAGI